LLFSDYFFDMEFNSIEQESLKYRKLILFCLIIFIKKYKILESFIKYIFTLFRHFKLKFDYFYLNNYFNFSF